MKRIYTLLVIMLLAIVGVTGCGNGDQPPAAETPPVSQTELTIAAAASLTDAANELATTYTAEHPEIKITYTFAASGTLQKQIEEGAPIDFFVSAGKSQMDALVEKELINESTLQNLLGNELVLIAPEGSTINGFDSLTGESVGKIGIGTPESVPAGKYAQETLTTMQLWDELQNQGKFVMAKDVREVLTWVETGNVDAGLVYRSDTVVAEGIKIVEAAPTGSSKPIVYPMAVIASSKHPQEAAAFEAFLASDEAMEVFKKYGFTDVPK